MKSIHQLISLNHIVMVMDGNYNAMLDRSYIYVQTNRTQLCKYQTKCRITAMMMTDEDLDDGMAFEYL